MSLEIYTIWNQLSRSISVGLFNISPGQKASLALTPVELMSVRKISSAVVVSINYDLQGAYKTNGELYERAYGARVFYKHMSDWKPYAAGIYCLSGLDPTIVVYNGRPYQYNGPEPYTTTATFDESRWLLINGLWSLQSTPPVGSPYGFLFLLTQAS